VKNSLARQILVAASRALFNFPRALYAAYLYTSPRRRIIEERVDEEVYVAAEAQASQTDVNQLAGNLADDTYGQEFATGTSKIILLSPSVSPMIWPRP
jgi:hypothetical protein